MGQLPTNNGCGANGRDDGRWPTGAIIFLRPPLSAQGRMLPVALVLAASTGGSLAQAKPPELIEIIPASGPAGQAYPLRATIRGTGFMSAGNIVEFGRLKIPDVPSTEAGRISIFIPKIIPRRSEVPPLVFPPGEYRVTVTTTAGTSNALVFTLTPEP
jgi:hypothetical protein